MARMNETPKPLPGGYTPERIAAQQRFTAELDRLMPVAKHTYQLPFECKICGALVQNRNLHFRFHTEDVMGETITALFGDIDESV